MFIWATERIVGNSDKGPWQWPLICRNPSQHRLQDRPRFKKKQAAIVPLSVGARLGPFELNAGRCSELLARFVINRNGTGTDVIYPTMQGEITLFQSRRNRRM